MLHKCGCPVGAASSPQAGLGAATQSAHTTTEPINGLAPTMAGLVVPVAVPRRGRGKAGWGWAKGA